MRTEDLWFNAPKERYTWGPFPIRGRARLLVVDLDAARPGAFQERPLSDLPDLVEKAGFKGKVWVNNSKLRRSVFEISRKSGHRAELILVDQMEDGRWEVMLKAGSALVNERSSEWWLPTGQEIKFVRDRRGRALELPRRRYLVEIDGPPPWEDLGKCPYPPKLNKPRNREEERCYEPLFAKRVGGIAVPTAGYDLTEELLEKLDPKELTLHPAPDNARKITYDLVEEHAREVRAEPYGFWDDDPPTEPVLAVGTTVVRTVEQYAKTGEREGRANVFLSPPYDFKLTGGLLTQFHYPKDPILALTCAFAGTEITMEAHREAVRRRMRIGGYGDLVIFIRGTPHGPR